MLILGFAFIVIGGACWIWKMSYHRLHYNRSGVDLQIDSMWLEGLFALSFTFPLKASPDNETLKALRTRVILLALASTACFGVAYFLIYYLAL